MSDERFDKHIKSKLETIRPPYEEAAWKKLQTHLPIPWYRQWLTDWGGWLLGGASSLLLLTTLYTIYNHRKETNRLHEEISTLKEQLTTNTSRIDTVVVSTHRVDTLYVVKVVKEIERIFVQPADNQTNTQASTTTKNVLQGKQNSGNSSRSAVTDVPTGQPAEQPQEANQSVINTETAVLETKFKPLPPAYQPEENVIREKPEFEKTKVQDTVIIPPSELRMAEPKPEAAPQKKPFKWPTIHSRVGVSADFLGMQSLAMGPSLEVFLRHNLSFGTGLLVARPRERHHKSPYEFNRFTGRRFEEEFRDFLPSERAVEDIHIATSAIKLPISLTYYMPSRSDFTFFATAGSNLDISVFQEVEVTSKSGGVSEKDEFEMRQKPRTFTSLFYGMGAQYEWRRIRVQAAPYFNFRFRKDIYAPSPRNFGFRTSLLYDFGK